MKRIGCVVFQTGRYLEDVRILPRGGRRMESQSRSHLVTLDPKHSALHGFDAECIVGVGAMFSSSDSRSR